MKWAVLGGALLFLSSAAWSAPAVLFEEVEVPGTTNEISQHSKRPGTESEIKPLSSRRTLHSIHAEQEFDSTADLRAKRRVGVGLQAAGATGLLGAFLELNFTGSNSAVIGYGGGPGFNAFHFQWRSVLAGKNFSPYFGFGYARWYNASSGGDDLQRTTPSILGSRFLSEEQKRTGRFTVDLLNPCLGLQFNNLSGGYAGMGLFAEVDFLTQVPDFSPVPTGALGILYYF